VYPSVEDAANSATLAQPWPPAAQQQPPAAMATGSGAGQPVYRTVRHPLVRPLPVRRDVPAATRGRVRPGLSGTRPGGTPAAWPIRTVQAVRGGRRRPVAGRIRASATAAAWAWPARSRQCVLSRRPG